MHDIVNDRMAKKSNKDYLILAIFTFLIITFASLFETKAASIDFISNYVIVELDDGSKYIVDVSKELDKNDKDAILKKVRDVICRTNKRYCDN